MKVTFIGNYWVHCIFAFVIALMLGIISFSYTTNFVMVGFLNFTLYFMFSLSITSLNKTQLTYIVPAAFISATILILVLDVTTAYFFTLTYQWMKFMLLYSIPFIIYNSYKQKEINIIVLISIILFLIAFFMY